MLTVRPSLPEDVPAQRELWKLAFGDSDTYLDNFYTTYYRPERVVVLEEDGAVRSMTAWFDTAFVVPGQGEYQAAYLYAVATHPDCRGRGLAARLLAGADEYFRSLGIPAVTTVPAEPSLHDFFGANGFRECFRILGGKLSRDEIPVPPSNGLHPASTKEYSRVREELLKDIPHIAYPEDALAYQAGCCALGDGGLF
ncbi:MAG: GNAT family N-acetyltransferase, partial [Lawsonibacter sp.]|nr:GNAT family N-acetyltransferase [Lawsonibacter sp.]